MKDKNMIIALLLIAALVGWGLTFLGLDKLTVARATVQALKDTGPFGDQFEITLPDGKVTVAGTIVSADEAKEFSYEREKDKFTGLEYDVVYHITPDVSPSIKAEIFRRFHDKK